MPTYTFMLNRTRLQSTTVSITARTADEAEDLLVDRLENEADPYAEAAWSDGETEGAVDYDLDCDDAVCPDHPELPALRHNKCYVCLCEDGDLSEAEYQRYFPDADAILRPVVGPRLCPRFPTARNHQ